MSKRLDRFGATLQSRLAKVLLEYQLSGTTASVTHIVLSPDLKYARIWISVFGEKADVVFQDILNHSGDISRTVAAQNTTKFSPHLKFIRDEGLADTAHIESLVSKS